MKIRENCYMLGLGSTGGKIYKEFVQRHYKGAAANGSEQDHKALGDVPNKYILQGFDGFGGHRERAMDCLAGNEDFIKFVEGIKEDIVFILFAGGGSTGSGCAPIVAEMLLEEKDEEGNPVKTVCPVIALPASGESLAKHKNAYETVQELQEISNRTFRVPLEESEIKQYPDLEVVDVGRITPVYGDITADMLSVQFVEKILLLIKNRNYTLIFENNTEQETEVKDELAAEPVSVE